MKFLTWRVRTRPVFEVARHSWPLRTDAGQAHANDPSIGRVDYYFPDPYVNFYDSSPAVPPLGTSLGPRSNDNITNYQLILE